jgi:prophage DNA circulation protein
MATIAPWRLKLRPASFKGVVFFVEVDAKAGGRRIALHEYPKRDIPYAEDMGRRAKRFAITAYVIGVQTRNVWTNYQDQRDLLINAIEAEGAGTLIRPTTAYDIEVVAEGYSVTERREKGGYAQFDITFIESGINIANLPQADTQAAVTTAVNNAMAPVPPPANTPLQPSFPVDQSALTQSFVGSNDIGTGTFE